VSTFVSPFADLPALNQVTVPDLWQQQAVTALREGQDVVVQAPTGSGKTLIFELWSNQGKNRGQAIYTVPTRALANDKLAEWRARGWDVGIATGDLAENLGAPVLVATLETQKNRLIQGDGPALLVVDEYQMLSDLDRGLNYELAIALAPPSTQLLLLSGSVANPQDVAKWLRRLGRRATVIRHEDRPVPLEEVHANSLSYHVPAEIRGYWPRLVAKALAEDLGPILIFAPRRQSAESMATELSRQLPIPNPLQLSTEQKLVVGEHLAKLLKARVAYHHSGLSYAARAGVIEPLAKAGQLRVVVATTGFVLITANEIRLLDAHPCHLSRSGSVDWAALLGIMTAAAEHGRDPFAQAVQVQERLFTTKPIFLGVEECLRHPHVPCGLRTDAERARHVRKRVREMLNSRGEWEPMSHWVPKPLKEIVVPRTDDKAAIAGEQAAVEGDGEHAQGKTPLRTGNAASTLIPALSVPDALERVGTGTLCVLADSPEGKVYGRSLTVAERLNQERVLIAKWIRRLTNWTGRQAPLPVWEQKIVPLMEKRLLQQKTPLVRLVDHGHKILAQVSLAELTLRVPVDSHGVGLWHPVERETLPYDCAQCSLVPVCKELSTATGTAMLWRRLALVDAAGVPTLRGRIVSFFSQGDGLAIAAALEDGTYSLDELVYDLANLDGGFRFCGDENRWGGRLAIVCHEKYGLLSVAGYLENGVPPKYGAGAEQIVASVHKNPMNKHAWVTDLLGPGDIDRAIIEWRSLLRQISHAPDLDWPRWRALQAMAKGILNETVSPTVTDLPPLEYHQTQRVDHRLILRRH